LIVSGQAKNVLLLTSDTYSKYINKRDRSVRTLFGDGASATLVCSQGSLSLGGFCYGTDGSGADNLIVPMGGCRNPIRPKDEPKPFVDSQGNERSDVNLYMNGSAIMEFALKRLPEVFNASGAALGFDLSQSEYFCFHQANKFMLEMIRKRLRLPEDRMILEYSDVGNTVSSTIPIAMSRAISGQRFKRGDRIALVGFGVGYSWGATYLEVQ
jgi:3-oxoacyl-[acyl-carrier-protein] synthase-3